MHNIKTCTYLQILFGGNQVDPILHLGRSLCFLMVPCSPVLKENILCFQITLNSSHLTAHLPITGYRQGLSSSCHCCYCCHYTYLNILSKVSQIVNPLQESCLKNPMDRGAWQATVHGITKSQTQLSDFTHLSVLIYKQSCCIWTCCPKS